MGDTGTSRASLAGSLDLAWRELRHSWASVALASQFSLDLREKGASKLLSHHDAPDSARLVGEKAVSALSDAGVGSSNGGYLQFLMQTSHFCCCWRSV